MASRQDLQRYRANLRDEPGGLATFKHLITCVQHRF
jgi:hypothetical protein